MGRFDNRRSPKMCRRKAQAKKKAREARRAEVARASRAGTKKKK
ncbi:MAG TPA: hypothetical protein VHM70_13270 [Polyangiaceae bacterium]|jgi:hypothetical protein|nr:hypothetical protein [Polyangiaceae bacterium]